MIKGIRYSKIINKGMIKVKQIKVILIGAGDRGVTYTNHMGNQSEKFKIVGVAEPIPERRDFIKDKYGLSDDCCFDTWEKILDVPKFADVAIVSTMDRDHSAPAIKALQVGYDLLLEKPVAPTPEECVEIEKTAKKHGRKVVVCHVLRYTPFYNRLKRAINSGIIGDVVSVVHNEDVGALHQAHSFVRGNWGNSERSSCMLLQKSCHDLDIIQWLLDKKCKKIQSFGSLTYFTEKNAPEGAPEFCYQGCPKADECIYNAEKIYTNENLSKAQIEWYRTTATKLAHPTLEDAKHTIRTTNYGRCVFRCDNDVVDHQVVNMEFEDDVTVTFTMSAFANAGRTTKILGTKGWLDASISKDSIDVIIQGVKGRTPYEESAGEIDANITGGHGGGDEGIVNALYDYVTGEKEASEVSEIGISCRNHMLVFAAEKARHEETVVYIDDYMKSVGME